MEPWVPVFYESAGFEIGDWITIAVGFGGAVVGAGIGAFVSYHLQIRANRDAKKRDVEARASEQRGQLLHALFRAMYVHADLDSIVSGISESHRLAEAAKLNSPNKWTRIAPIVGRGTPQAISAAELAPLVDAKEFDLVARYCELLMSHSAILQTQDLYEKDWLDVSAMMPATITSTGMLQTGLTEEQHRTLNPRFTRLNGLATSLEERSAAQLSTATDVVREIGMVGQRLFGYSFPKYRVPSQSPADQMPVSTGSP